MNEEELNKFLLSIAQRALSQIRTDIGQYFQLSEEELVLLDEELERKDEDVRKQIAKPIAPHDAAKAKAPFDYEGGMAVSPNIGMTRIREQQESLNNMYLHLQTRLSEIEDLVQEIDDDRLAQKVTRELDAKHGELI